MNPWCLLAFLAVVLVTSLDAQVRLPYANEATRKLLLDALKDGDRVWRVRSLTAFTEAQDDRNKDEVKFLLNDKLDAIRYQAEVCMATSDIAQPPASYLPRPVVAESSASITHRDPRVRSVARVRMLLSDATYKDDFSELLNDPDYFVRREVSRQVVKTRANASLEVWRRLLASPRVEDRVEAAWAVGELGAREEESKLIGFLDSDSERLRLVAIDSLMKVGGDVTCQAIGSAVLKANGKTFQGLVRLAITQKDRAALPSFRQIAADEKAANERRRLSLDVIASLVDVESKPLLLKIVARYQVNDADLRQQAVRGLGEMGVMEAIAPMKKLLTEKVIPMPMGGPIYDTEEVRLACLKAFKQFKAVEELSKLIANEGLAEASETIRKTYVEILTEMTGTRYDYRRVVNFNTYFLEGLTPKEMPEDLKINQGRPAVFKVE